MSYDIVIEEIAKIGALVKEYEDAKTSVLSIHERTAKISYWRNCFIKACRAYRRVNSDLSEFSKEKKQEFLNIHFNKQNSLEQMIEILDSWILDIGEYTKAVQELPCSDFLRTRFYLACEMYCKMLPIFKRKWRLLKKTKKLTE